MKYFIAAALALILNGCFGGGAPSDILPPELQQTSLVEEAPGLKIPEKDPFLTDPVPPEVPPAPTTTDPAVKVGRCDDIVADLERSIVDMNFCSTDADCLVGEGSCPFGCYLFHNKAIDFADYEPALTQYRENCSPCEYKCASRPREEDRRCREGRCVDVRYE